MSLVHLRHDILRHQRGHEGDPRSIRRIVRVPIGERGREDSSSSSKSAEATFTHRTYWSTLTFERNDDGEVTRLLYDGFGEKLR